MKLESLKLWVEKDLLSEEGNADYGFLGFISGVFANDDIEYNTTAISDYSVDFQYEFSTLIRFLQSEAAEYFIRDLKSMTRYCDDRFHDHIPYPFNRECWGFRVLTEKYAWYIGCTPWNERRHFSIYCYDRNILMNMLANDRGLPAACYGVLRFTGERIYIRFGEDSFDAFPQYGGNSIANKDFAREQNQTRGVSFAQQVAMENGVIFGWDTPVADPTNYDENGHWYISTHQGKGGRW